MDLQNLTQEEFERIEAYLNGQLSNNDLVVFEKRLEYEDGLKSKVEEIKIVLSGLETQALKEQLNVFHDELLSNQSETLTHQPKVRNLNWKKIAVAAVLIIGLGSFWLFNGNNNDRLYSEYFYPDPGLPTTMSSSDNYEFYEAMVDYKQGKYKTAISKWKALRKNKPNNDTLNYFIGVAHMANKNESIAISYLENASDNINFPLIQDAYYYLGLAYLKEGKIDEAKANFKNSTLEYSKELILKLKD